MKDERLMVARGELVAKYRAHSGSWPDGIDNQYDRWYRPEEWTDEGAFLGALELESNKPNSNSQFDADSNKPELKDYRGKDGQADKSAYQRDLMRWRRAKK
jgi:hypothetical protein